MVKEKIKMKRTPISGEKDARLNELEKLKAKRNSMKTNSLPIKAKQKLEFQQSKGFMTFQTHAKISKLLNTYLYRGVGGSEKAGEQVFHLHIYL